MFPSGTNWNRFKIRNCIPPQINITWCSSFSGIHSPFVLIVFPFSYAVSPGALQNTAISCHPIAIWARGSTESQWEAESDHPKFHGRQAFGRGLVDLCVVTQQDGSPAVGMESEENVSPSWEMFSWGTRCICPGESLRSAHPVPATLLVLTLLCTLAQNCRQRRN